MRRAIPSIALVLLSTLAGIANFAHQAHAAVDAIDAYGMMDYRHKPNFKLGDWVKYHITSQSSLGATSDYFMTVLIAGEEEFWGDKCFWIETWTQSPGGAPQPMATLMSYAIFDDSLGEEHEDLYRRKTIVGDVVNEELIIGNPQSLKSRFLALPSTTKIDTLEADTVQTPLGLFHARKVLKHIGYGKTASRGDSTLYVETQEARTSWRSPDVPILQFAREDVDKTISRRAWAVGHSEEGVPLRIEERGIAVARLVAMGHGDLKPILVPEDRRLPATASAASAAPAPAHPAARARPHPRTGR